MMIDSESKQYYEKILKFIENKKQEIERSKYLTLKSTGNYCLANIYFIETQESDTKNYTESKNYSESKNYTEAINHYI